MKKILIVTPGMDHGGTNRSLLNLLGVLDREKYEIDLFAMQHGGVYDTLFSGYNMLPESRLLSAFYKYRQSLEKETFRGRCSLYAWRVYLRLFLHADQSRVLAAAARRIPTESYDAVVAFQESIATEFVSFLKARRRIAWVHCDYSRHIAHRGGRDESGIYSRFSRIIAVSQYTAEVFRRLVPSAAGKVLAVYNLMDTDSIMARSREEPADPDFTPEPFTLISIGRFDPVKRFARIPEMAAELKKARIPFRWYIIGDGGQEKEMLLEQIRKWEVSGEVILLGIRDNPYPYMLRASAVVCPSSSEACPNVVNEARILHIPVVAADFPTASEFIRSGEDGIIVPVEQMGAALRKLWEDKSLYDRLRRNLRDFRYDNGSIAETLEKLFDGETA